ncbi:MAG: fumarylacetoacetate hydrolase family protein [Phycisphaerales bacterium]|jgi:2-keto-4-pentenoate hydratase/2-oxohepta-3-ene-1,7-dioic acid hydratase in catechol pathway|nr:fumarylacetoacetate hydrolase family protein [Phycisphaerales bacterium]MDP7189295.1 fumarylacetoacetate hydrolase family protein [Phycisphaerales bacterium]MDP7574489.1 fumarylacetoacetate hydrolase family protein [Phycisphaerales bacterium]HCA39970.1 5-carboxymethyl-2-hydroxymuconate isomerase [Phycisphaerales bacterium]
MNPPPAIFCIGRNYAAHAAEMQSAPPERPTVFMKNPASVIGPQDDIVIPPICHEHGPQVDFEGELAAIIGRDCRDVDESNALDFVFGWSVANDISARWWQKEGSGGQWIRGKSFDTFCPITPPVPASSVSDPQNLQLETRLNGELMQQANTADMIFPVALLIAELSRGTTLLQGTVILTGTPSGVGAARTPPRFLREGDVVEVTIEGIGTLCNPVR